MSVLLSERRATCRPAGAAFTLIELLVVIAILATLAGLLFPVFAQARAMARKSTCISNLRQVGMGVLAYTQDYDEQFPPYFDHAEGDRCTTPVRHSGPQKYWPELVSPYIQKVSRTSPVTGQARIEDLSPVFVCPESRGPREQPASYQLGNISSYGISDHIVDWWTPTNCRGAASRTLADVVAPAECLLLTETWDWFTDDNDLPGAALALGPYDRAQGVGGAIVTLDGKHNASYAKTKPEQTADPKAINNVFFCDGHVQGIRVRRLTASAELWSVNNNNQWP